MSLNLKNRKYHKKTVKNTYNLRGGKNFIDFLFNLSDKETKDGCDKDTDNNDDNQENQNIRESLKYTDNILKKWIENTDQENGMTLYFANATKKDSESASTQNWVEGFHGNILQNESQIELNDYIKDRLNNEKEINKKCLEELNSKKDNGCLEALNEIQINDFDSIRNRVEMNNKINTNLLNLIQSNKILLEQEEKELERKVEEMKQNIENKKKKIQEHSENISKLLNKNTNYNQIIKSYIASNPDYNELKSTSSENFVIDDILMNYVVFALKYTEDSSLNEINSE
jgi:hypothetical protein